MSKKSKEVDVNDLLNSIDDKPKKKTGKKKTAKNDDWDQDEDNGSFGMTIHKKSPNKKVQKKTNEAGWVDDTKTDDEPSKQQKAAMIDAPKEEEKPKKKGIFQPVTSETRPQKAVNVEEEYFPDLGAEPEKQPEKKPEVSSPSKEDASGPKRFTNAKKNDGANFVPLEQPVTKDPFLVAESIKKAQEEKAAEKPVEQEKKEPVFKRATEPVQRNPEPTSTGGGWRNTNEKPAEPEKKEEEPKISFGGPKKFISSKKKTGDEESKSEADILREQKEREVEEKLQKEKEEIAKRIEAENARREKRLKEKAKEENGEKTTENGDSGKITRFTNNKKKTETNGDSAEKKGPKPKKTEKKEDVKEEPEEVKPSETKTVTTTASSAGWGQGQMVKKSTAAAK